METIGLLFDTSDFPARWHCGNWSDLHGWVHVVSDLLIFLAYMSIPACLLVFKRERPDVPFHTIFLLFGAFILACGITHLNEAIIFWKPAYRWAGLTKALTAIVSLATVVALVRVAPQAMALRSPAQLEAEVEARTSELARSNADLQQFAYVASHDLKAPLRAIDNLSSWLAEDLDDSLDADNRKKVELLRGRVKRMESLLDDLLAYSRVGREVHEPEPVATHELIAELTEEILDVPARFEVVAGPELPELVTERVPLQLIFRNLIGNAIKHHDRSEGRVTVSAREVADHVEFSVSDDGPGIAPEFHERVFEIFQTLRPRDEVEGTGMGLALIRRLVQRHGCKVWIGNAPGGRGATFLFTWPRQTQGSA